MQKFYYAKTLGGQTTAVPINMTCPACKLNGTFEQVAPNLPDIRINVPITNADGKPAGNTSVDIGIRKCPNVECRAVVFTAKKFNANIPLDTYPKARIDFDTTNVPASLVSTFREALICTAEECYAAAAIMVRRTLEELCSDKKANGDNLQKRLKDLAKKIIIPEELLTAADDLRLLGNDAAHIKAKSYDNIGEDEILIAIELTKELIKASYQYQALLNRLKARKKTP